ncbi:hypothetical protein H5410_016451 [Solanum commersonii]|uniref:Transposase-associated domain-containing protein n=1 Tax=Solanum commersonii TaxID=4109 RepID=A0A9J5ZX18_SOLCO|nr:hypothetical protein H5410_016451 [Solanum commersonii]
MHYETGVGLKPEFIDGARDFIEHTMTLDIFKNNGSVLCPCIACGMEPEQYFDEAPNEEARCFYDQLEESSRPLCKGRSVVQGHIGRETSDFYSYYFGDDVSCRINRPNRNEEGDIDLLFPLISIYNQNGRGSKKRGKRGFFDI